MFDAPEVRQSPTGPQVTIPLAYFDALCRAYYGQPPTPVEPRSPAVEVTPPKWRDMGVVDGLPPNLKPMGAAARKVKDGSRQHQADEEPQGSGEGH